MNRGSTRANSGTRGSRASSDMSEGKKHKKRLIRLKICVMIYTAPHNLILVYLSVNFNSQMQMFDVSTFLFSFQCLKSWRPSDPLSFSLKNKKYIYMAFLFYFIFIILVFGVWALWKNFLSNFPAPTATSHKAII